MQLTKTEQKLLDKAKANFHKVVTVESWVQFTSGKPRSGGSREVAAAWKLVEKGLLKKVSTFSSTYYRNGYSTKTTDYTFELASND